MGGGAKYDYVSLSELYLEIFPEKERKNLSSNVVQVFIPESGDVDGTELRHLGVPGLLQHQARQQVVVITPSCDGNHKE